MNTPDFFKAVNKKSFEVATKTPSLDAILNRIWIQALNKFPIRILDEPEGNAILTDQDRNYHCHILGGIAQGKSKYLEMMVCMDIIELMQGKSQSGACLIDSTDNGATMKKVLKFCASVGFEKVLIINPHFIPGENGYVVPINPVHYDLPEEAAADHLIDSFEILWQTVDFSTQAIISKYLPHVFRAIHQSNATLADTQCFTVPELAGQRTPIIDGAGFISKLILNRVYKKQADWNQFQSSARRLEPVFHSILRATFGSRQGISFETLISKGWVILVNLSPEGLYGRPQQRLLGTIILNEIIRAAQRIRADDPSFDIPYNIYIDEFGHYATKKIADIFDYRRHLGIRLTIAHQRYGQIKDEDVLSAVRSVKNKLMFHVVNKADCDIMIRDMGYGGDLPLEDVSYTLRASIQRQECVAKIMNYPPVKVRLRDWPDPKCSPELFKAYISYILRINSQHYRPTAEVWEEIRTRGALYPTKAATAGAKVRSQPLPVQTPGEETNNPQGANDNRSAELSNPENPTLPRRSPIFNNSPNSKDVLRDKSGRSTRKRPYSDAPPE